MFCRKTNAQARQERSANVNAHHSRFDVLSSFPRTAPRQAPLLHSTLLRTTAPLGPLGSSSSLQRRTPELVLQKGHASFRITSSPPAGHRGLPPLLHPTPPYHAPPHPGRHSRRRRPPPRRPTLPPRRPSPPYRPPPPHRPRSQTQSRSRPRLRGHCPPGGVQARPPCATNPDQAFAPPMPLRAAPATPLQTRCCATFVQP